MQETTGQDIPDSPDERKQRRRVRRWKRRVRIVGPFLGVCALIATLGLSVDLIEYQPQEPKARLSDRPMPEAVIEKQHSKAIPMGTSLSTTSVTSSARLTPPSPGDMNGHSAEMDVTLSTTTAPAIPTTAIAPGSAPRTFAPPVAPYATRGRR